MTSTAIGSAAGSPCGACRFMRRRCKPDCIFAPFFTSEYSSEQFEMMHRVFGASNLSKLLSKVPLHLRHDAVATILYEAQARIEDPIYGCTAHVFALQKQVQLLQEEVMQVKAQLTTEVASQALQNHQHRQESLPGMLRSFSDSQFLHDGRPLEFQDHHPTALLSEHIGFGSANNLQRSCSDSRLISIHRPIYVQDYSSDQPFLQQMGCDDTRQTAQVLADNLLFQEEVDKWRDWLLLDEENAQDLPI